LRALSAKVTAVIVVVIVVIAVAGAVAYYMISKRSTPPGAVTLVVATYKGAPAEPILELAASIFEQEHPGVTVDVVTFPYNDYIDNELTPSLSGP